VDRVLTAAGHESVHWIDVGEPNAPDRVILEHAHRNGQVILTQDLDFGTLLAVGGLSTPSVIQFRAQAVLPSDVGEQLLAAIDVARSTSRPAHLSRWIRLDIGLRSCRSAWMVFRSNWAATRIYACMPALFVLPVTKFVDRQQALEANPCVGEVS